jgi:hypothetical protein
MAKFAKSMELNGGPLEINERQMLQGENQTQS